MCVLRPPVLSKIGTPLSPGGAEACLALPEQGPSNRIFHLDRLISCSSFSVTRKVLVFSTFYYHPKSSFREIVLSNKVCAAQVIAWALHLSGVLTT